MDGLFEGLAQKVLAALRVGEVPVDREDDVVGDEGLGGCEESQVALDGAALVRGEPVGTLPESDVGLHGDLGWHPVVIAAGEILLPCPAVLEREKLVDVGAAVDHGLVVDAHSAVVGDGCVACCFFHVNVGADRDGRGFVCRFGPIEYDLFLLGLLAGFAGWVVVRSHDLAGALTRQPR